MNMRIFVYTLLTFSLRLELMLLLIQILILILLLAKWTQMTNSYTNPYSHGLLSNRRVLRRN